MNHAKKLGIVTANDMYLEFAEGGVDPGWKVDRPIDFHRFREKLAIQQLTHKPLLNKYPGDDKLLDHTKTPRKKRPHTALSPLPSNSSSSVATRLFADAWQTGRLCGFLAPLHDHIGSVVPKNESNIKCAVCGARAYQWCSLCQVALHYKSPPEGMTVPCFFLYHDAGFCGLARADCKTLGTPKRDWKMATGDGLKSNKKSMKEIHKNLFSGNNSTSTLAGSNTGNSNEEVNDRCI